MAEIVNALIDLNIDGDCTNLGALSVLHVMANRGEARILATTACFQSPLATGCIRSLNRYYGRPDLPVGILHRQKETHPTPFMKPVNERFCPDHPEGEDAPDTVDVMRRALIKEIDDSVTLIVVGCFASVAALLESGPDGVSPLTGQELAEKKIKRIVAMAGQFPTLGDVTFGENNVVVQIPAAKYVVNHWNKELVFSGYEIGIRTRSLLEFRFHGDRNHPLRMMYEINDGEGFMDGNPSWDHTAVLEAVRPGRYFDKHEFGRVEVDEKGVTAWRSCEGGKHTYLIPKTPLEEVAGEINNLIFPEWKKYAKG